MQSSPPYSVAPFIKATNSVHRPRFPSRAGSLSSLHVHNTRRSASGRHQKATTMALQAASTVPRALLAACLVLLVLGSGNGGPSSLSVLRGAEAQGGGAQCLPQLNGLLACRAYLVPGAPDPSADCCSALSAVSHECACSTMGIINSLPGRCNLAQVNCSA